MGDYFKVDTKQMGTCVDDIFLYRQEMGRFHQSIYDIKKDLSRSICNDNGVQKSLTTLADKLEVICGDMDEMRVHLGKVIQKYANTEAKVAGIDPKEIYGSEGLPTAIPGLVVEEKSSIKMGDVAFNALGSLGAIGKAVKVCKKLVETDWKGAVSELKDLVKNKNLKKAKNAVSAIRNAISIGKDSYKTIKSVIKLSNVWDLVKAKKAMGLSTAAKWAKKGIKDILGVPGKKILKNAKLIKGADVVFSIVDRTLQNIQEWQNGDIKTVGRFAAELGTEVGVEILKGAGMTVLFGTCFPLGAAVWAGDMVLGWCGVDTTELVSDSLLWWGDKAIKGGKILANGVKDAKNYVVKNAKKASKKIKQTWSWLCSSAKSVFA